MVGMAEKHLTKWQGRWSLIEDGNGDQVGEYLRKKMRKGVKKELVKVKSRKQLSSIYIGSVCTSMPSRIREEIKNKGHPIKV